MTIRVDLLLEAVAWLRDESLEDCDNLTEPGVIDHDLEDAL